MADNMELQISITGNNEAGPSLDSMNSSLDKIGQIANEVTRTFQSFIETVVSAFTDANRSVEELIKPIEQVASEANNTGRSLEEMTRALFNQQADRAAEDLARSIQSVGESAQNSQRQIRNMEEAAQRTPRQPGGHGASGGKMEALFGNEMQNNAMYAGMSMGAAALPIIGAVKSSMDVFGQFSQAMSNVNSMMGLSQDQLTKLSNKVMDLSKTVPGGPVALANALYGIVGAGVPAADQMDVLATAAKAATAGQTDVSTATSALITVMDSYGLKGKDVGKISDTLFAANAAGAMTFNDLAKSIGTVAGPAAQSGVAFSEVAAATAALTNQGLSAQRATEGLRALLMGIMSPTAGAAKEAKKLGIEWDAGALKSKGMTNMINEAMKATHGNSQELKKLIPNIAAWTAAVDLGGKGADSFKQALQTMAQSSGATNQALAEQEKGYQEKMNQMTASIQRAQIAFANGLAPVISDIANKVADLANKFANLSPNTQKIIGYATLAAGAFLTLGSSFFMAISGIGAAVKGFEGLRDALMLVTGAETLMEALSPVGWVIGITAAVTAVGVLIYQHWGQIRQFLQQTWDSITNIAKTVWNGISNFFKQWGTTLLAIFVPVIGLPILIAQHWKQITTFANQIWNGTVNLIKNIWNGAVNWIKGVAQDFVNIIVAAFQWMYNHNYYFKDLVNFIKKAWDTMIKDATTIWNGFTKLLSDVWNVVKNAAQSFWNGEVTYYTGIWNGIVNIAKTVWNGLSSFLSGLWKGISSGVSSGWNSITRSVSSGTNNAINAIKGPFNDLGSFFSGLWSQAEQWGSGIINGVVKGIQSAASSVGTAISGAVSSAASFFGFHGVPGVTKHASGGIFNSPHLGLVAEAGPEAIIPLSDPTRGLALWQQAGQMLGALPSSMALPGSSGMALAGGGGGNVYNYITVHASGNITRNEQALGDIVSRAILNKVKMQGRI